MTSWESLKAELTAIATAPKWRINNTIPLKKYYIVASNMWTEVEALVDAKDWQGVYVAAKKFLILTSEAMPKHKSYKKANQQANREKLLALKKAAIAYLETSSAELEYLCDSSPHVPVSSPSFAPSTSSTALNKRATKPATPTRAVVRPQPAAASAHHAQTEEADDPEMAALMARLAGLDSGAAVDSTDVTANSYNNHSRPTSVAASAVPIRVQPARPQYSVTVDTNGQRSSDPQNSIAKQLAQLAEHNGNWGGVGRPHAETASAQTKPVAVYPVMDPAATIPTVKAVPTTDDSVSPATYQASIERKDSAYSPAKLANLAQQNGRWRGVNLAPLVVRARYFDADNAVNRVRVVAQPRTSKSYDHVHPDLRKHAIDQDFLKELRDSGARVIQCAQDGNCLFRAISCQLYGTPDYHAQIRRQAVAYMRSQPERFKWLVDPPTAAQLEVYLRARENPVQGTQGEWGDHPEILALEEVFDRPIEIYSHEQGAKEPRKTHLAEIPDALKGVTPFRLSFHGDNHYNSLEMARPGDTERVPLSIRRSRLLQEYRIS